MLVLDIPRPCPPDFDYIDLPLYHRVHLGLAAHIPLHGCLLATSESPHLPELVLSPFEFEKWDKIWRLNLTLKDRPGLFNEVTEVLGHNKALLLAAESSATQQQRLYQLEVVMELEDEDRIGWIRYCLLTRFFKEMTFMDEQPRLRIQRLQSLFQAKRDFEEQKKWPKKQLPQGFSPEKAEVGIKWVDETISQVDGKSGITTEDIKKKVPQVLHLMLPKNVQHVLQNTVGRSQKGSKYNGFYLRLSDTKNRFLRVVFFSPTDPSIYCRIEYSERSGALADITRVLKSKDLNILSAYLGPGDKYKSRLELVLRSSKMKGKRSAERKAFLEKALSEGKSIADLQILIGYPRNYSHDWPAQAITPVHSTRKSKRYNYDTWVSKLRKDFLKQYKKIKNKTDPDLKPYQKLADQIIDNKYIDTKMKHRLFISCHYTIDQVETIAFYAKQYKFEVVTGENLLKDPTLARGLIKKIRLSTHFLGVWSSDGAQKFGDKLLPSPWLLWEFGVAEAFGLTCRLLIQNDIDQTVWQKLAPQVPHLSFTTMNFAENLKLILKALSELPPKENC